MPLPVERVFTTPCFLVCLIICYFFRFSKLQRKNLQIRFIVLWISQFDLADIVPVHQARLTWHTKVLNIELRSGQYFSSGVKSHSELYVHEWLFTPRNFMRRSIYEVWFPSWFFLWYENCEAYCRFCQLPYLTFSSNQPRLPFLLPESMSYR